jgi:pyruvate,water dikinase
VQTINAAESRPGEIVINVGLGLGEGIVSGRVAADHVVVAKDSGVETLRFRYLTADKRRRVILDERFGRGTVIVETLAHQRLRPALEYPELCAIVEMAVRLEQAYAQPIDLEFAFEDAELHVLQVRPVPGASNVWAATAVAFPLRPRRQPQEDRP